MEAGLSPATRTRSVLANPIASHMSVMRTTLLPGLVEALRVNLNRGEVRVRIFEIGRVLRGRARSRPTSRAPRRPRLRDPHAGAMGRSAIRASTSST